MKLVLCAARALGEFQGGTERVVDAQARALAELGHEVRLLAGTDRPGDAPLAERQGDFALTMLPRAAHEGYALDLRRPRLELLARAELRDASLAHVHGFETLSSGLVRALAREVPVCVTLHDHLASCARFFRAPTGGVAACPTDRSLSACARCVGTDCPERTPEELERALGLRRAEFEAELAAAARVFVPSAHFAAELQRVLHVPAERLHVVRHGLTRALPRTPVRAPWDGARPLEVLHFGNLARAKGTLDLVRALAALPAGAARLTLAGPAVEPGLEAELDLARGALALRRVASYDTAGLAELAAAADLAAFPSRLTESYGLVVEEALALGLPAWVAERGALPEHLACGAGRVLPAGDPSAWTRAFQELLAFPKMLGFQRAALPERVRSAADSAAELARHYAELAPTPRIPAPRAA